MLILKDEEIKFGSPSVLPEHLLKPSSEINVTELINQEHLLLHTSPAKSLPLRSVDTISQQDNYRKISNISTASTDSAYTSDTNMTYKQPSDVGQVPNVVEAVSETYVTNGNDIMYHQDSTMYQNVESTINQDASMFIPNSNSQWNYQMNNVIQSQPPSTTDDELQRKISTVSTVSNLSSLSSDSVQGLVQQDIQHHSIIHEENAVQNNQNVYVPHQEVMSTNLAENANYGNVQLQSSDAYLPNAQLYQENQTCLNYPAQFVEEPCVAEENSIDIVEPPTNYPAESDNKSNLR